MQILGSNSDRLVDSLKKGKTRIAVYGVGHVGSAITTVWLRAGAKVICVDKSQKVIENIRKGNPPVSEPLVKEFFKTGIKQKRLTATSDSIQASKTSDFKIVIIPVGLRNGKPNLVDLLKVTRHISLGLKKGDLVSINSSVPPGTTINEVLPILEEGSGLRVEKDFGLVYSPERIYIGQAIYDIEDNYPSIVGGIGKKSLRYASILYGIVSKKGVIEMSSTTAAETEKIFEGIYRDVNIALANELEKLSKVIGVDFWQVRNAANSQHNCLLHRSGVGVGGPCIPIYPIFASYVAKKMGIKTDLITKSREINSSMPKYTVSRSLDLLKKAGKTVKGSKICILGLAYRGNISDDRFSPSYGIIHELERKGCLVSVHDSHVKKSSIRNLKSSLKDALSDSDLIIVATDHDEYRKIDEKILQKYASKPLLVFDGRGILKPKNFKNSLFTGIGHKNVFKK
jgi:nucleotide sugar dehydrogenase